jgi:hypothetical protein
MSTDYRALCARMADELDHYRQLLMDDRRATHALAAEARAALAQPGPVAPTDEDLYDLAEVFNGEPVAAMRRALELWGTP